MKVWILQTGEPLQIDSFGRRPMRAINLSEALLKRGHEVTIWSSDFDHYSKSHRFGQKTTLNPAENLTIRLIASPGYKSNRGFSRLADHSILAINLFKEIRKEDPPDVAFVGYPPIEIAWVMIRWLKKHSIPSVLDIKDAWPDVLKRAFPRNLQGVASFLLQPYYFMMRWTFRNATGLSSISPQFLKWSISKAKREIRSFDQVNYLANKVTKHSDEEIVVAEKFWDDLGVHNDGSFRCSYIGTLTDVLDFRRVIECAADKSINFVIAGSGPILPELKQNLSTSTNFVLPGWISDCQSVVLAKRSTLLLAPYTELDDFAMSLPNKFLDAINHAKPIVTSIPGFAAEFIVNNNIGIPYSNSAPKSLSNLLKELSLDEKRIKEMSRNAEILSRQSFNGETLYDQTVDLLEIMAKK